MSNLTAPAPTARRRTPIVGARTELARYTITAGERVLYGHRIDGVVRISDNPASGHGRAYLVERELEQDGNAALHALVKDYLQQAQRHDQVPMRHCPLDPPSQAR